jgi:hypothetical protein
MIIDEQRVSKTLNVYRVGFPFEAIRRLQRGAVTESRSLI